MYIKSHKSSMQGILLEFLNIPKFLAILNSGFYINVCCVLISIFCFAEKIEAQTMAANDIPVGWYSQGMPLSSDNSNLYLGTSLCGPTCVMMIVDYYNDINKSEEEKQSCLRQITKRFGDSEYGPEYGYTLVDLLQTTKQLDKFCDCEIHCWSYADLKNEINEGYPVIVHVTMKMDTNAIRHFMVLRGIDEEYVYVNDPQQIHSSNGENIKFTKAQFIACWSSKCITIHPPMHINGKRKIDVGTKTKPKDISIYFKTATLENDSCKIKNLMLGTNYIPYSAVSDYSYNKITGRGSVTVKLNKTIVSCIADSVTDISFDIGTTHFRGNNQIVFSSDTYYSTLCDFWLNKDDSSVCSLANISDVNTNADQSNLRVPLNKIFSLNSHLLTLIFIQNTDTVFLSTFLLLICLLLFIIFKFSKLVVFRKAGIHKKRIN